MKVTIPFRFLVVTALDHYSEDEWTEIADTHPVEVKPMCWAGWLVAETEQYMVLANGIGRTIGDHGWQSGQRFVVLKSAILGITEPLKGPR